MDGDQETLREILRLERDSNKMLHKMRRSAFIGGIIRFIIYAVLLAAPIWLYLSYLGPMMENMMRTVGEIQGTGAKAQAQFSDFQQMWKDFQSRFTGTSE